MNSEILADSLFADREEMTEGEKQLFMSDFKRVCADYFECDGKPELNLTKTDDGYSVCIIFAARRIKHFRRAANIMQTE